MNRTKLTAGIFASVVVLLAGLGVGTASAAKLPSIDTAPSAIVLPIGGGLTVTMTTGVGGTLTDVAIDNAGYVPVDGSATSSRVKIENTTDGIQLVVKSKNNEQRITARSADFTKFLGSGTWTGDVFGDGSSTVVAYTVGGTADAPTVSIDLVTPGGTITNDLPTSSTSDGDDEDDSVSARASVRFVLGGQSRTLSIKVEVHTATEADDDSESGASLRISLSRFKGVAQDIAALQGIDQVWTAKLCDGTTQATITYQIGPNGELLLDAAGVSPAPSRFENDGQRAKVRFAGGERVEVRARVSGTQVTVDVKERFRCDTAPATVNGSVVPTTVGDDDDDDDHDGEHHDGGDDDGDHHGGDDGGDHHGGGDD